MSAQPIRPALVQQRRGTRGWARGGARTCGASGRCRRGCPRASRRAGSGPPRTRRRRRRTRCLSRARSSALAAAPGRVHLEERELDEVAAAHIAVHRVWRMRLRMAVALAAACALWLAAPVSADAAGRAAARVPPHRAGARPSAARLLRAARHDRGPHEPDAGRLRPPPDDARHRAGRPRVRPRLRPQAEGPAVRARRRRGSPRRLAARAEAGARGARATSCPACSRGRWRRPAAGWCTRAPRDPTRWRPSRRPVRTAGWSACSSGRRRR